MNNARRVGLGTLLAAVAVYLLVARPAQQAAQEAADAYGRVRSEQREATRRFEQRERRAAVLDRVGAVPAGEVRERVVKVLHDVGITRARLEVRSAPKPAVALLVVTADGGFAPLVRLLGQLVQPGSGLVLQHVVVSPRSAGELSLSLEAAALGASS